MALSLYGIEVTQSDIGRALRPYQNVAGDNDDKSVTLAELAVKAEEYGFVTFHRPAGNAEIVKAFIAQDIPVITRTWLEVGNDIGHYRVIKGYDESTRSFLQDDSLQGANLWYTYEEYDTLWHDFNYEFLVLVPKEKELIARGILGNLQDEGEAWQSALTMSEREIAQNPDNTYARFNKSVALYHLGRYEESIREYEAIQDRLTFRTLWYQIEPILSYYKAGRYQDVIRISDSILTNHNRAFSELHYLKGESFRTLGNESAAQESFQLATQYNNTSEIWKVNLK